MTAPDEAVERFRRADAVFDAALDLPTDERYDYVDRACGEDAELRQVVRDLLDAHRSSGGFLESPAVELAAPLLGDDDSPSMSERVGPFRIVREIGHGGMGTVYLAERTDGQFEQRVALKVIRQGGGSTLIARFLEERRILALLEHPRIARLVDGGITAAGIPWFAMEYVEGDPIDRYCDAHALSIERRLELFDAVCDAVQYAHQRLVVHRDLKPSNILVTADGSLKLLDFGIAKLLDPLRDSESGGEQTVWRALTPEYAAPEQVRGDPISTATDVYALGVLVYLLLTGRRPYDVRSRAPSEVERIVCTVDPPLPSASLEPRDKRRHALRGDLDAIVMRALRKEPERRYSSAAALRDDLRRYREGRPVAARPETATYRAGKFVRRHAAAVTVAVVAIGLVAAAAIRERVMRQRAEAGTHKAEQVTDFMIGLFEASEQGRSFGDTVTARALLDRGLARARAMSSQPELQAQMFDVIGQLEGQVGEYDRARPLLETALATRRRLYGTDHPDVATTLENLAAVVYAKGDFAQSASLWRESLGIRRRVSGPSDVKTTNALFELAASLHAEGKGREAQPLLNEWAADIAKAPPEITPLRAEQLDRLATFLEYGGKFNEAEQRFREELALTRLIYGEGHDQVAIVLSNIALLYDDEGEHERADTLMRQAVGLLRAAYPEGHPKLASNLRYWGVVLEHLHRYQDAAPLLREGVAMSERYNGDNSVQTITGKMDLSLSLAQLGQYDEAATLAADALSRFRRMLGDKNTMVDRARVLLGDAERGQGKYAQAESLLVAGYAAFQNGRGPSRAWRNLTLSALARLYDAERKPELAAKYRGLLDERR